MHPSELIDRLRSRPALVAVILVGICGAGLVHSLRFEGTPDTVPLYATTNSRAVTSKVRDFVPVRSMVPVVRPPPTPPAAPVAVALPPAPPPVPKPLPMLQIHAAIPAETNPPALAVFAPAGRLIRAVTVNSIDSANVDTPIIALVTDSLWFDGEEVIPAGSELHGRASVDRLRDRIVSSGPWTIVWQNGEELTVNAIALDRDDNAQGRWGERDGSAGLTGQVLKNDSSAEIRLFLSTFMSGAAGAFQQTQPTLLGPQVLGNARNAAMSGASAVLNNYAQQIAETIRKDGIFVRVPAGKQMYVYLTHTLDRSAAKIGNLRAGTVSPPALHSSISK